MPYTLKSERKRTGTFSICMPVEMIDDLDKLANEVWQCSRSAAIRRLLKKSLGRAIEKYN